MRRTDIDIDRRNCDLGGFDRREGKGPVYGEGGESRVGDAGEAGDEGELRGLVEEL